LLSLALVWPLDDGWNVSFPIESYRPDKAALSKEAVELKDKVLACYKRNPEHTLDCWKEVQDFKRKADALEWDRVKVVL
jgi:hypothetical protein